MPMVVEKLTVNQIVVDMSLLESDNLQNGRAGSLNG
jgi:hypothetical protein